MNQSIKNILNDPEKLNCVTQVAFNSADSDKSGQIDKNELAPIMKQIAADMGAHLPSDDVISAAFQEIDTDHSGKIDFNEFKALIKKRGAAI